VPAVGEANRMQPRPASGFSFRWAVLDGRGHSPLRLEAAGAVSFHGIDGPTDHAERGVNSRARGSISQ
jgi:hypothetical protein